jgi:septal ring factor EnvC (AmiA/AmiB activator)
MSTFKNTKNHALKFELGGRVHEVEPGAEVEIPSRLAYAVKSMGLPLELVSGEESDAPARVSDERPTEPIARLWFDRAVEQRDLVNETKRIVHELRGSLDVASERNTLVSMELTVARDELRTTREELESLRADLAARTTSLDTARAELAAAQTERTALLARVTTLEEAATAPAPKTTPKAKATTPPDTTP